MVALDTVTNALSRILDLGLIPLLAHPERYSCCSPDAVNRWRSLGAAMQVDGPTLITRQTRGQRARDLITHGLADIIAGDNHGDDRSMAQGQRFLLAQEAHEQAELLTRLNPGAILADGPLQPVPPMVLRTSWFAAAPRPAGPRRMTQRRVEEGLEALATVALGVEGR